MNILLLFWKMKFNCLSMESDSLVEGVTRSAMVTFQ